MRVAAPIVILVSVAACGGDASESLGRVAFAEEGTRSIVVVDVSTGARSVACDQSEQTGQVSISPDGSQVAHAHVDPTAGRVVHVSGLDGGTRELWPSTGEAPPRFSWGRDGWMCYLAESGGAGRTVLVLPEQTEGRFLGTRGVVQVLESPVESLIAYNDCAEQTQNTCLNDLIVERADGSERQVLVGGASGEAFAFTPDGRALATNEDPGDGTRLLLRYLDGDVVDLGAVTPEFHRWGQIAGGSLFSPSGDEILSIRDGALVALRLDGSGERSIAALAPSSASFTAMGIVLYETSRNTEDPPDDTPEIVYSLHAVGPGGDTWPVRVDDPSSRVAQISATGTYVTFDYAATPVHRVADGNLIGETGGIYQLGFAPDEAAVVVAGGNPNEIRYAPLDGAAPRFLGVYEGTDGWPFSYAPRQ